MADPAEPSDQTVPPATTETAVVRPAAPETTVEDEPPATQSRTVSIRWRKFWLIPLILVVLTIVYYLIGMYWLNAIDADLGLAQRSEPPQGGSQSVAVAADLVEREIVTHRWVANDPFFMP